MKKSPELNPSGLVKIRQRFDPGYSYVVFVKKGRRGVPPEFGEVTSLFKSLKIAMSEHEVHENIDGGNVAFVVKLDPVEAAKISQEVVNLQLPADVSYTFYGSQLAKIPNRPGSPISKGRRDRGL